MLRSLPHYGDRRVITTAYSRDCVRSGRVFLRRSSLEMPHSYGWQWENLEILPDCSWHIPRSISSFGCKSNSRLDQKEDGISKRCSNIEVSQSYSSKSHTVNVSYSFKSVNELVKQNLVRQSYGISSDLFIHFCTTFLPKQEFHRNHQIQYTIKLSSKVRYIFI